MVVVSISESSPRVVLCFGFRKWEGFDILYMFHAKKRVGFMFRLYVCLSYDCIGLDGDIWLYMATSLFTVPHLKPTY